MGSRWAVRVLSATREDAKRPLRLLDLIAGTCKTDEARIACIEKRAHDVRRVPLRINRHIERRDSFRERPERVEHPLQPGERARAHDLAVREAEKEEGVLPA